MTYTVSKTSRKPWPGSRYDKDDEIFQNKSNILLLQGVSKKVRFRHPVPLSHDNLKFIYETRDRKLACFYKIEKKLLIILNEQRNFMKY